ncbi:MAG: hypothetical protein ACXVPU_10410 [Bacteroidia bacterium]
MLSSLTLVTVSVFSQQNNQSNQAMVTIVGDTPEANNANDFVNTNPSLDNNNEPQIQQQLTAQNNVEPTLENGFHMRFEVNSQQAVEPTSIAGFAPVTTASSSSSAGSSASSGKSKKHGTSVAAISFNAKKKIRSKIPKRKKKYHPHLCGRF